MERQVDYAVAATLKLQRETAEKHRIRREAVDDFEKYVFLPISMCHEHRYTSQKSSTSFSPDFDAFQPFSLQLQGCRNGIINLTLITNKRLPAPTMEFGPKAWNMLENRPQRHLSKSLDEEYNNHLN